jgi:hypothetical protein
MNDVGFGFSVNVWKILKHERLSASERFCSNQLVTWPEHMRKVFFTDWKVWIHLEFNLKHEPSLEKILYN